MGINTISDAEQVANKMGAFGLNNAIEDESDSSDDETPQEQDQEIEAEGDDTEDPDEESDERGSVDASDDDGDEETGSEEEEEEDSEDAGSDGDAKPNPEMVALNEKIDRLTQESQRNLQDSRSWQSRFDRLSETQNKTRAAETNQDEDEFDDLDDDEVITGADLKASAKRNKSRKQLTEAESDVEDSKTRENAWLSTRSDAKDVVDFYNANNLENDPDILGQTTGPGIYAAVKLKMAEKSAEEKVKAEVEKQLASHRKKLVKGKGKGKVPITGGGGGARKKGAGTRGLTPVSSSEKQYMNFFGPDARIENPKR